MKILNARLSEKEEKNVIFFQTFNVDAEMRGDVDLEDPVAIADNASGQRVDEDGNLRIETVREFDIKTGEFRIASKVLGARESDREYYLRAEEVIAGVQEGVTKSIQIREL